MTPALPNVQWIVDAPCFPSIMIRFGQVEDGHLAGPAQFGVASGDVGAPDLIAVSFGHAHRPLAEAGAVPLKPVVWMPKTMRRDAQQRVELRVRRRDDHRPRLQAAKDRALEGAQALRVEMLDRLDKNRAIEPAQPVGRVKQRCIENFDVAVGRLPGVEARPKSGQRPGADVDANDALDTALQRDPKEQIAFATAKIENRTRLAIADDIPHRLESLLVQPARHDTSAGWMTLSSE